MNDPCRPTHYLTDKDVRYPRLSHVAVPESEHHFTLQKDHEGCAQRRDPAKNWQDGGHQHSQQEDLRAAKH